MIFQKRKTIVFIAGAGVAILLAVLAWQLPIGEDIRVGNQSFVIQESLSIFGRQLILTAADRSALLLIYIGLAFWFIGALVARTNPYFVPIGMAIAGLLTAALAVEPFLYAALIIEIVVLVSIPLLSPPGLSQGRGAIRYLTFLTLGFPFVLFTGWLLAGVDTNTADETLILFSFVLLGLGFWLLLGVFPFHTWIPMISEESHPYSVAYLLYELPLAISLFGLGFLDRYAWMRDAAGLYLILEIGGVVMVALGGLIAAFQRHLGRILGYAVLVEIGLTLLAIRAGLDPAGGVDLLGAFYAILLPRALSLGVWALSLVAIIRILNNQQNLSIVTSQALSFRRVKGLVSQAPIATIGLLLAHFSLAGFPLLIGFPVRLAIWQDVAQHSVLSAVFVFLGYAGLITGGLRTLAVLVMSPEGSPWEINETRSEMIFLVAGSIALILMGIFPQWFTPELAQMSESIIQSIP
jgi:NADH:ubiquinone oxidoreductase subunit 2 (subunit N)